MVCLLQIRIICVYWDELAKKYSNVHYHACISGDDVGELKAGRAADVAMSDHPDLKGWRLFLCGAPGMVRTMRKNAFLAGASMPDISADAFTAPEHKTD